MSHQLLTIRTRLTLSNLGKLSFVLALFSLLGSGRVAALQREAFVPKGSPCPRASLEYAWKSFASGGKLIRVEVYQPRRSGKYPVIIMIHGAGGLLSRQGKEMPVEDNFGEIRIACSGYIAFLVHYFDRSGILSTVDRAYMQQQSAAWLETLRDSVGYASSMPDADPARIGLFGESLGGYLALSLAMQDPRIKAVAEYAGGIQLRGKNDPAKLPPVLIQHGTADSIVPVSEALRLEQVLSGRGVSYRAKIYAGINHYPSEAVRAQIQDNAIHFFDGVLKSRIKAEKGDSLTTLRR